MNKIFEFLFPQKTKWIDLGLFNKSGRYTLVQMRITLKNNKKEYRRTSMGFINDYVEKENLYKASMRHNSDSFKIIPPSSVA